VPDAAGGPAAGGAPSQPPALVRVADVVRETVAPELRSLGNVRPRLVSIVASGADGIVAEFPVEAGDFVAAGTLLSRLRMEATDLELAGQEALLNERRAELEEITVPRAEDVAEAKARLQAAEVISEGAERRRGEQRALGQRGAANASEVKDAEDEYESALQELVAARAVYQRISTGARPEQIQQVQARCDAQQKHVEFLKAEREKRYTRAPFDGYVVEEHTNVGQWLAKGASVVTLARLDEVEVEVQVDQQFVDQVIPGRPVVLQIQGTGRRDGLPREWSGLVQSVVPRSDWASGSRSFPVIIRIRNEFDTSTNPPLPALREGMMAEATFEGQSVDALMVPKDALVRTSRGSFVFTLNPATPGEPRSVQQVMVEVGISRGTMIQAIGDGLEAGQQVVTEGAERLRTFQSVQILESAPQVDAGVSTSAGPKSADASTGPGA
jgi:RND family efflux transporter MFP subunit